VALGRQSYCYTIISTDSELQQGNMVGQRLKGFSPGMHFDQNVIDLSRNFQKYPQLARYVRHCIRNFDLP